MSDGFLSGDGDDERCGEVVFAGYASWSMVGKSEKTGNFDGVEDQILWGFHRLKPLIGVKIKTVVSGADSCTCMAISDTGLVYSWGRNDYGQLGLGHTTNVYNPTQVEIPDAETIVGGACGPHHTLIYSAKGTLFSAGAGKCGQLGIGRKIESQLSCARFLLFFDRPVASGVQMNK